MREIAAGMVVVALLLVAAPAGAAAPRITVGPVQGNAKTALPGQLAELLCGTYDCVRWKEVSTRGQPDFAKARSLDVGGILTGAVGAAAGGKKLSLSLLTTSPRPVKVWTFPLTPAGRIPASATPQLERDLNALLRHQAPAVAPPPVRAPEAMPAASSTAPLAATGQPPQAAHPPQAATPQAATPQARPPAPSAAPAPAAPARRHWLAAAEVGLFASQRQLSYGGVSSSSGTLLGFDASGMVGPSVSFEVFPVADSASVALSGAGLHAGLATSVGLKTLALTGEELPTRFTRLEVGARWRSPPLTGLELVLVPGLAWVSRKLTVSPAIPGLPNSDLSGVRVGLSAEARVAHRVTVLAGLGWVKWMTAKELIDGSPAYFPGSSAAGLEAEVGAGMAVWGQVSVRILGQYASTRYTLAPDPTGTYVASSAEDRYLGLRAVARGEY